MILAGDIGGTKTVLALCEAAPSPDAAPGASAFTIVREHVYLCADFDSLEAVLAACLPAGIPHGITAACFGVAGPVVDGAVQITNLPWRIEAAAVATQLGVPVALINDLQATALGALVLPASALAPPGTPA